MVGGPDASVNWHEDGVEQLAALLHRGIGFEAGPEHLGVVHVEPVRQLDEHTYGVLSYRGRQPRCDSVGSPQSAAPVDVPSAVSDPSGLVLSY